MDSALPAGLAIGCDVFPGPASLCENSKDRDILQLLFPITLQMNCHPARPDMPWEQRTCLGKLREK